MPLAEVKVANESKGLEGAFSYFLVLQTFETLPGNEFAWEGRK